MGDKNGNGFSSWEGALALASSLLQKRFFKKEVRLKAWALAGVKNAKKMALATIKPENFFWGRSFCVGLLYDFL
ncbi:MAG TPA: hypothetical protein VJB56_01570 [Candidatus Paceibacterota bacterium]